MLPINYDNIQGTISSWNSIVFKQIIHVTELSQNTSTRLSDSLICQIYVEYLVGSFCKQLKNGLVLQN